MLNIDTVIFIFILASSVVANLEALPYNPDCLDISQFRGQEDEGVLLVEKAGETLFLLKNDRETTI